MNKPTNILIVLDGWGVAPKSEGNAIELARKPFFDSLVQRYPYTTLDATGYAVGLGENERSGSEAGHSNIGAGRVIKQDSQIISEDIQSGKFFSNASIQGAMQHAIEKGSDLHLMGLLSDADSPHSDPEHLYALLKMAKVSEVKNVYLHLFTDGRDAYEKGALKFLAELRQQIQEIGVGVIATVGGRYYGMDRVKRWERLKKAYDTFVLGDGPQFLSAEAVIQAAYDEGITDEFIIPAVIVGADHQPVAKIKDNDAVIFFNLRGDRASQMTKLLTVAETPDYPERGVCLQNIYMCTLTDFGQDLPVHIAYSSQKLSSTLPAVLGDLRQLYIAEEEKFPHVTYFINGGSDQPVAGEQRIQVLSQNIATYDQDPTMSAEEVTDIVVTAIQKNSYDFIVVNYANADMVGHTGKITPTVQAIECLDGCLQRVVTEILNSGGFAVITADHGNADEMIDLSNGQVSTMHSKNPVPFILVKDSLDKNNCILSDKGVLGNITPTILDLLNITKPAIMLPSLIQK